MIFLWNHGGRETAFIWFGKEKSARFNKAICYLKLHLMQKSKWHMAFSKRAFLFSSRIITLSAVGFHITDKEKLCSLNCRAIGIRRRPTLPDRYQSSTIGTEGLNFCVRYGNRWDPFVIATGNGELFCYVPWQLHSFWFRICWPVLFIDLKILRIIKPSTD